MTSGPINVSGPISHFSLVGIGAAAIVLAIARCVYLLYFHPLAKFPGPKIAAVSDLYSQYVWAARNLTAVYQDLHRTYGDVVRVAPNELSFASVGSYRDIYGHAVKGKKPFLKTTWYSGAGPLPNVFSTRDAHDHSRQRRNMATAFSLQAVRSQEPIIQQYIDLLMNTIGKFGSPSGKGIDMTEAFNWLTFDTIGALSVGESFNALPDGRPHPWMNLITDAARAFVLPDVLRRAPLLRPFIFRIMPKDLVQKLQQHSVMTSEKTKKRLEVGNSKFEDYFGHMQRKNAFTEAELCVQAVGIIIAGSETTATGLLATFYYLVRNPDKLKKLQHEIRGRFKSREDINSESTHKLTYLNAVIEEGLRLFPPLPNNWPRMSPGAEIDGHYVPAGVTVSTCTWATQHDERYFHEPYAFKPERWIGEGLGDNRQASQPFQLGPRACLGINLAYKEMQLTLASLVLLYDFELAPASKDVYLIENSGFQIQWEKPSIYAHFYPRAEQE